MITDGIKTCFRILVSLFLLFTFSAFAETASSSKKQAKWIQNLALQGFGTLGYTQTDKYEDTFLRRDVSQDAERIRDNPFLMDSRIGLQLTGDISDHWDVVIQSVLRHKIDADISDYITIAFARYTSEDNWQLTIGRQPFDLFLVSEHRNVGYAYDWVRPPIEFYGTIPADSYDGVKVSRTWGDLDYDWHWFFAVGRIEDRFQLTVPRETDPIENVRGVETTSIEPIYSTGLTMIGANWRLHGGISFLEVKPELDIEQDFQTLIDTFSNVWPDLPRIGDELLGTTSIRYYSLGAEWEEAGWKIQSEFGHIDADNATYAGQRAYLSVSRRIKDWLGYVLFGYARDNSDIAYQRVSGLDIPDPAVRAFLQTTEEEVNFRLSALKQNQYSTTIGVRWDFAAEKAVKFQCERHRFDAGSNAVIDRVNGAFLTDQTRTWCSFAFDWVF